MLFSRKDGDVLQEDPHVDKDSLGDQKAKAKETQEPFCAAPARRIMIGSQKALITCLPQDKDLEGKDLEEKDLEEKEHQEKAG